MLNGNMIHKILRINRLNLVNFVNPVILSNM